MFGGVLILGGLHGEGSGAEDLLVLHLVVEHEQGDRRLREVLEGRPQCSLIAVEAIHQGAELRSSRSSS